MGDYSVPKEIRDLRPPGTIVKKQGNGYYVYRRSSTKVKVVQDDGTYKWKTQDKMGPCLGAITQENGFIPNAVSENEEMITVLDYGNYAFSKMHSSKVFQELDLLFKGKLAIKIYLAGLITFNEGFTYMTDMSRKYAESAACMFYPGVPLGYESVTNLYEYLGRHGKVVDQFEQRAINASSHVVGIDGHVIACTSEKNDLSEFGYKHTRLNAPQLNWICAHDLINDKPLASEFINGSTPDKSALKQLFNRFVFANTHFYVDRGFNTDPDKQLMSLEGSTYTVPMISGRNDYNEVYGKLKFDKRRWFIYDKNGYSSIIYYTEFPGEGKVRYIAFKDTTRESAERKSYCEKLKKGMKGYTAAGLEESEKDFGLFLLETTEESTAEEVFCGYKSRWGIETYYNYVDNVMDFNALYQQDYCKTQGVGFIVQIAGSIFSEVKNSLTEQDETVRDVMDEFRGIKAVNEKGRWNLHNITKSRRTLAEKLQFQTGKVLW